MNISLFGLSVDASGALKTIKDVGDAGVGMAQGAAKNAQLYADAFRENLNRVARQYIPETMRAIDQLVERQRTLASAAAAGGGLASSTMISPAEFARSEASWATMMNTMNGVEKASGAAFTGLGRIRQGMTSLVASLTGTMPIMDRILSAFGSMAVGSTVMLGVLGGLAAVAYAYRTMTADARAAAEAQEKALQSLKDWHKEMLLGDTGKFSESVSAGEAQLADMRTKMAKLQAIIARGGDPEAAGRAQSRFGETGEQSGRLAAAQQEYARLAVIVRDGEAHLREIITDSFLKQRNDKAQTLAELINSHNATHAERLRAIELLKQDRALLAQYTATGGMLTQRSALGSQIEALDNALHPKDPDAARREAAAQRERDRLAKEAADQQKMIDGIFAEEAASKRLLAATLQGTDAAKDANREEEVRQALLATGIPLDDVARDVVEASIRNTLALRDATDALNAADKQRLEQVKQAGADFLAEQKRQAKEAERIFRSTFSSFFTDILTNGKSAFQSLWDAIKVGFIKMIADLLAVKAMERLAGSALAGMIGLPVPGRGGVADASTGSLAGPGLQGYGSAAGAGGLAGYGIGQSAYSDAHPGAGSYARGALGGAASGAAIGFAVAGPLGAAVGAVTGFVGGLVGVGHAAAEARKHMEELQKQLSISMAALRATVSRDTIAQGTAQINAEREQLRKQIEDAYPGGGSGSAQVARRNAALAEMNKLEDQRIAQLKQEYALTQARAAEDLQVRLLTAQGHDKEAAALKLQLAQQREREDLIKSFGDTIDPTEAATLALLDQVQAQEKLKAATDQANTSALNMVQGYKLQAVIFGALAGRGAGLSVPTDFTPPTTPNQPPIVIENVLTLDGKAIARSTKRVFKEQANRKFGDETRWAEMLQ